ncbi:hypothetical protein AGABI1DRAFT_73053 [Agaricus bisporus var. burnettii JB137-S8]|uniref:Uncharacterized protein n=1 Tax=Agaricus bisporus var. burnettii (strain JB137-S8 / ATCC MYA-4627 / FGSC 10392) TaxID=597362 RepID=K5W060_AGABU|nr:uncharacterized protein AGABI1DRAFT_73053 [Agaricus bisporus var. burnettii JB137-S8]EKM80144.1 hypothetical protein AGABI1DRAFT_73053 [Agaricus bisporus var. burnettii JB137-S8]
MSDQVLQHVLADLRPYILPKLLAESSVLSTPATSKKVTVDTHRGDTYQFCYFLRRTEPHSIVLKTRNYVARKAEQPMAPRAVASLDSTSRDRAADDHSARKKRKLRSTTKDALSPPPARSAKKRKAEPVAINESSSEEEGSNPRVGDESNQSIIVDADQDVMSIDVDTDATFNLPIDEEEEKPKPALQLKYKGFNIYGQCLCIIVEPWPTVRITKDPLQELGSVAYQKSRHKEPHIQTSTPASRAQTPLFLADDDMGEENSFAQTSNEHDSDEDSDRGGMMAFSQALNLAGDNRPGAAEDEQEMEGAVLFGDADENRQL